MKAVSLFSGAGGMDVGFSHAGFETVLANDADKDACETYRKNIGPHIICDDIDELLPAIAKLKNIDCVYGGPPCQGFSVAGRMDPADKRSNLVFSFMNIVKHIRPRVFVMENVKALGTLSKFQKVREYLFRCAIEMGYHTEMLILNARNYEVPQSRERVFLIGIADKKFSGLLKDHIISFERESQNVRSTIIKLGPAGSKTNSKTVNAKISFCKKPVLRKSPYAGMLFNGQGRPVNPDSFSPTIAASIGGGHTPIIDEHQLYKNKPGWVEMYHRHLMSGGKPYQSQDLPKRLRRMTVDEAMLLQTFPDDFRFIGSQSSVFRQIGNAVPCNLAKAVGRLVMSAIDETLNTEDQRSLI